MYTPILASDYVPFEFPTIVEFVPEIIFNEEFKFQFNPIAASPAAPDQAKSQYDVKLAKAAYRAGIPFNQILESIND